MMDTVLCDELLQEFFHRLPSSSFSAVSLVSKRWRRLLRSSTVALSLRLTSPPPTSSSISSFLSSHPYLSSLSLTLSYTVCASSSSSSDHLIRSVAFSSPNLRHLCFLSHPVSLPSLLSLSSSCSLLTCLTIALSRPLILYWLGLLHCLKDLALFLTGTPSESQTVQLNYEQTELHLQSLSISGIRVGDDDGLSCLWMNCKQLKRLKLTGCECVGDRSSYSGFIRCLKGLEEVELRTCRSIVDGVLEKLAENSVCLDSLLIYDGGSRQGLVQFIVNSRCELKKVDLRLPLDLVDDHLIAMAEKFRRLSSIKFESCCLVTGEGLKAIATHLSKVVDELSLVNCDGAIERETGLLTTIGQKMRNLKVLDLSYNETLKDKEVISMLASCCKLKQLKVRGCNKLTDATITTLISCCKQVEVVDIAYCNRVTVGGVELFVKKSSSNLRKIHIEVTKISVATRTWASTKGIQIVA